MRTVLRQDENRLVDRARRISAPYSAALRLAGAPRIAADAVSPLGDRPPRHPSPSRSSRHSDVNRRPSRGSPKRIVRRGSGRRLGRLAFVAGERALQLPRLGEDPGGTPSVGRRMPPWHRRSRWGPRSTGASAPARFPGAARPGRHEPAEPILGTLGAGQRRAGSGGTAIRGAAGCRRISHDGRGPRRGKTQEERPPGMPDAHGQ